MSFGYWLGAFARVTVSVLGAGVFFFLWLAVFLQTKGMDGPVVKAVRWCSAPVVTATGFAAGAAVLEHLTRTGRAKSLGVFIWPLAGCVLGAAPFYQWPMLIVFGMFGAGTASMALRELLLAAKRDNHTTPEERS
ncbi:MAG: hypothetical protein ACYSWU_13585 [Planctomycetota bacterium]